MRFRLLLIIVSILFSTTLKAQNLSLTFTSVTDAKFFLYVNGVLQNQQSKGMVTVKGLESKEMDKTIGSLIALEDKFTQTENKLDKTINKMIMAKLNKEAIEEIDFIN